MMRSERTRFSICASVLIASALAWTLLLASPVTMQHCAMAVHTPQDSIKMWLAMNSVTSLLAGWALMVAAMMLPKLILPVRYIYDRSLRRRRFSSILLFLLGYMGVWTAAGVVINAVVVLGDFLMPHPGALALCGGLVVIVWQFSPLKQACLNRGHAHPALAAFGPAAARDALAFGVVHGCWCVGAGWALMLFPLLLPEGHLVAMIVVTVIMTSEHLERPRSPRWRISFSHKLLLIIVAQLKIRLSGSFALTGLRRPG